MNIDLSIATDISGSMSGSRINMANYHILLIVYNLFNRLYYWNREFKSWRWN